MRRIGLAMVAVAGALGLFMVLRREGASLVTARTPAPFGAPRDETDPYRGYFSGHWCNCWRVINLEPVHYEKIYDGVLPRGAFPGWSKAKILNLKGMDRAERLLCRAFVGLVNRHHFPMWYIADGEDPWLSGRRAPWNEAITGRPGTGPYRSDGFAEHGIGFRIGKRRGYEYMMGLKRWINEVSRPFIRGAIIYDPALVDPAAEPAQPREVLNVVRTLAAVETALPLTPALYEALTGAPLKDRSFRDRTPLPIILDTRKREDWKTATYHGDAGEAARRVMTWAFNTLWPRCDHHTLAFVPPAADHAVTEYAAFAKMFCFYVEGDSKRDERQLEYVLSQSPVNIPIIGTLPEGDGRAMDRHRLLRLFSRFGKFFIGGAGLQNITDHSAYRGRQISRKPPRWVDEPYVLKQKRPAPSQPAAGRRYVAFLVSCRNELGRFLNLRAAHWDSNARGEVPIGWCLPPTIIDAAPQVTRFYYNTATENDAFVAEEGGVGALVPAVYAAAIRNRDEVVAGYLKLLDRYARSLDLSAVWIDHLDPASEALFAKGLEGIKTFFYGERGASSYLTQGVRRAGDSLVIHLALDVVRDAAGLEALSGRLAKLPGRWIVVGIDETGFGEEADLAAGIAAVAKALPPTFEVLRPDDLAARIRRDGGGSGEAELLPRWRRGPEVRLPRVDPGTVKIDGDLGDWKGVPAERLEVARVVSGKADGAPSAGARLAWDDRFLYLAAEVRDEHLTVDDVRPAEGDGIILALDTRPAPFREPRMTEGFYRLRIVPAGGLLRKPQLLLEYPTFDIGLVSRNKQGIEEILSSVRTAGGYVVEAAIPLANFPALRRAAGVEVGVNVAVEDRDGGPGARVVQWTGEDMRENVLGAGRGRFEGSG